MNFLPVRCAIVGAGGQLAYDLARTFNLPGEVVRLTRADLDVLDRVKVEETLRAIRPTHVLNGAAYNQVDRAEEEPAAAFAVNAEAVGTLSATCQALGATFVHFSTDYVFDGRKGSPYLEGDAPNPLSAYAASKLAGERMARERCERVFIFRVCGLFGIGGLAARGRTLFVERMLRMAQEGHPIRVVSDQVLAPSYTLDLARKVWRVLTVGEPGLYNLTNAGQTSMYDFAREIFRLSGVAPSSLAPVTMADFGAKARRPPYSVLAHGRLAALGEDDLQPWNEALAAFIRERKEQFS